MIIKRMKFKLLERGRSQNEIEMRYYNEMKNFAFLMTLSTLRFPPVFVFAFDFLGIFVLVFCFDSVKKLKTH